MSAADVSSSSAALPRWVREMTASVSKSRGYVVSSTAAGFVVKVHPATPRRGPPPWVAQEASAHPLRDERREGAAEEQRDVPSARQRRSANRARDHREAQRRKRVRERARCALAELARRRRAQREQELRERG